MRRMLVALALLAVGLPLSGCDILVALGGGEGMACNGDPACPAGLRCVEGRCVAAGTDAAPPDQGLNEHPRPDAAIDEQRPDAASDGALPDGALPDAALPDAAQADVRPEASVADVSAPDTLADRSRHDRSLPEGAWFEVPRHDIVPIEAALRDLRSPDVSLIPFDAAIADSRAPWWNASYGMRRRVTVEHAGPALTQYQVMVEVPAYQETTSEFTDVRFVDDSGGALDHWLRSWTSGVEAEFLVELPSIPTGGSGFWLYYGNAAAVSASNGEATFPFFDDFDDNSLDLNKWQVVENTDNVGTALEQNQRLELAQNEPNRAIAVEGRPTAVRINSAQGVALFCRLNTKLIGGTCRTQTPSLWLVDSSGAPWFEAEYRGWTGDVAAIDDSLQTTIIGSTSAQTAQIVASVRLAVLDQTYGVRWIEQSNNASADAGLAIFNQTAPRTSIVNIAELRVRLRFSVGGSTACQQSSGFAHAYLRAYTEPEPTTTIGSAEAY